GFPKRGSAHQQECASKSASFLSYPLKILNNYIRQITLTPISALSRRSDEDDPSGCKYRRLDDDNVQDKERFA
ncbi:hypothetical protein HN011_000050, partial [Eciton burchellii]